MQRIWIVLFAILALAGAANAQTPQTVRLCAGTQPNCALISAANPLPTTATITPSGTQDINIKQIQGAVPSLTNPLWVFPATGATFPVSGTVAATQSGTWTMQPGNTANTTPWLATINQGGNSATVSAGGALKVDASASTQPVSGTVAVTQSTSPWVVGGNGTAGTAASAVLSVQGIASMTPVQVTLPTTPLIASGSGVINTPTSVSTGATTRASGTAAASSQVLKSSAGNLYDLKVTIGATSGYLLLFDATSLPSNGAVTPVFCERVNSDGTAGGASFAWPTPFPFATGITAGFSTTGCFTLTASATAAFFGGYK